MMSARGSSPKIASDTLTEPTFLPSSVVTFSSMSAALRVGSRRRGLRGGARREPEFARLGHAVRQSLLHRIAHGDPTALDARHGAFDQNEPALDIGLHDPEIERRHPFDAQMAGHFLVLEGLAGVLAAAGRTDRAMGNGNAVARAQAGEIPALHAAGEALAGRNAGHVHVLSDNEMIGRNLGANGYERIVVDAEFGQL